MDGLTNLLEDENNKDKKYIIIEKKGSGGFSKVFLVETLDGKAKYAAKILKIKDKEKEQKKENKLFDNEVNILKYLKDNININYITKFIDSGIGEIKRENRPNSINKYLILEYAEKGSLFNYIHFPKDALPERFCKRIF